MFRIPLMDIQDTRVNLETNNELLTLIDFLTKEVEENRENWGIKGKGFKVEFDLELKWYPIFSIDNRWLASALMRKWILLMS